MSLFLGQKPLLGKLLGKQIGNRAHLSTMSPSDNNRVFQSIGRCSGSGIVLNKNGDPVPHRCMETIVYQMDNNIILEDPLGQFHIELDRRTLTGTGTIVEPMRENIIHNGHKKTENIYVVSFEGSIRRNILRVESECAPCFWLEVTRNPVENETLLNR